MAVWAGVERPNIGTANTKSKVRSGLFRYTLTRHFKTTVSSREVRCRNVKATC